MRAGKARTFWLSFAVTLAVLLPLIAALAIYGMVRSRGTEPVEQSRSDVAVRSPGAENVSNLLVVTAGEQPAFLLMRLDALEGQMNLSCLPGQLNADGVPGGRTLESSYRAAGPARAARLLEEMLGIKIDKYLAIAPQSIGDAFGAVGTARVNLTTVMIESERAASGLGGRCRSSPRPRRRYFWRIKRWMPCGWQSCGGQCGRLLPGRTWSFFPMRCPRACAG